MSTESGKKLSRKTFGSDLVRDQTRGGGGRTRRKGERGTSPLQKGSIFFRRPRSGLFPAPAKMPTSWRFLRFFSATVIIFAVATAGAPLSFENGAVTAVADEQIIVAGPHFSEALDAQALTSTATPISKTMDGSYAEVEAALARAPLTPQFQAEVRHAKLNSRHFRQAFSHVFAHFSFVSSYAPLHPHPPFQPTGLRGQAETQQLQQQRSLQTVLPVTMGDTFTISRSNLLTTITVPQSYSLQFDMYPVSQASDEWRNVLHFTQGGDGGLGNRLPGIWLCHLQAGCVDKGALLVHYFGFANGGGAGFLTRQTIPQNQWTTIKIIVDSNAAYLGFEASGAWGSFKQGGSFPGQNNLPSFASVKVFASDPWYVPGAGQLRNIQITALLPTPGISFPVGLVPAPAVQRVRMGNLLARVVVPPSYVVTFDIFPIVDPKVDWRNVLLMTNTWGAWGAGQRMPGKHSQTPFCKSRAVLYSICLCMLCATFCHRLLLCQCLSHGSPPQLPPPPPPPRTGIWFCHQSAGCPQGTQGFHVCYMATGVQTCVNPNMALPIGRWTTVRLTVDAQLAIMTVRYSGAVNWQEAVGIGVGAVENLRGVNVWMR